MAFWSGLRRLGRNRHYNRGIVHYNRGEYAEAVHAFEEALSSIGDTQDPDYSLGVFYAAEARGNLALAHLRAGDRARRSRSFAALSIPIPDTPTCVTLRALLERAGRVERRSPSAGAPSSFPPISWKRGCSPRVPTGSACRPRPRSPWSSRAGRASSCRTRLDMDPWTGLSAEARECLRHAGQRRSWRSNGSSVPWNAIPRETAWARSPI